MIACEAATIVCGMDVQETRRAQLGAWVAANGGHAAVVAKYSLTNSEGSYLSQVVNGYSIGEKSARNWEAKLKLPDKFLDQDFRAEQPPAGYLGTHPVAHPMSLLSFDDPPQSPCGKQLPGGIS